MSIELKGRGYASMLEASWISISGIARELGWVPEYETKSAEETGLGYPIDDITERSARDLAKILYGAIHAIEADCLSEPLIELMKTVRVQSIRDVADLAYGGSFYID